MLLQRIPKSERGVTVTTPSLSSPLATEVVAMPAAQVAASPQVQQRAEKTTQTPADQDRVNERLAALEAQLLAVRQGKGDETKSPVDIVTVQPPVTPQPVTQTTGARPREAQTTSVPGAVATADEPGAAIPPNPGPPGMPSGPHQGKLLVPKVDETPEHFREFWQLDQPMWQFWRGNQLPYVKAELPGNLKAAGW